MPAVVIKSIKKNNSSKLSISVKNNAITESYRTTKSITPNRED